MLSYAAVEASRDSASASPPSSSHGVASLSGRLRKQEDRFRIARPLSAPALQHAGDGEEEGSCVRGARLLKGLHLYAVYDGHGGSDVSQHCSERLHAHLASLLASGRALDRSHSTATTSTTSDCGSPNSTRTALPPPQRAPLLRACSVGAPALLASNCSAFSFLPAAGGRQWPGCGGGATGASTGSGGNAKDKGQQAAGEAGEDDADVAVVSAALRAAFAACDRELAGTDAGEFVGSTAVVALVGRRHIWVAHCGDSRAALLRAGTACALTADHKPDREDEASRIRSCGGRVVFNGGSPRVMGMLAMSRSIGDHYLRPYVIAEPEVVCLRRSPDDELLILATDGLWDVLRCADAANLASRRIASCRAGTADGNQPSTCASAPADAASAALLDPCQEAASALAQAAVDRGSRDDITVVVVDVSLGAAPATKAAAAACDAVAVGAAGAAGAGDGSGTPRTRSDGEEGPLAGGSPALGRGLLRACSGVPCMAPFGASPVHAASPPQQQQQQQQQPSSCAIGAWECLEGMAGSRGGGPSARGGTVGGVRRSLDGQLAAGAAGGCDLLPAAGCLSETRVQEQGQGRGPKGQRQVVSGLLVISEGGDVEGGVEGVEAPFVGWAGGGGDEGVGSACAGDSGHKTGAETVAGDCRSDSSCSSSSSSSVASIGPCHVGGPMGRLNDVGERREEGDADGEEAGQEGRPLPLLLPVLAGEKDAVCARGGRGRTAAVAAAAAALFEHSAGGGDGDGLEEEGEGRGEEGSLACVSVEMGHGHHMRLSAGSLDGTERALSLP